MLLPPSLLRWDSFYLHDHKKLLVRKCLADVLISENSTGGMKVILPNDIPSRNVIMMVVESVVWHSAQNLSCPVRKQLRLLFLHSLAAVCRTIGLC